MDEDERMRGIKDDSKVSALNSWNNEVAINWDKVWPYLEQIALLFFSLFAFCFNTNISYRYIIDIYRTDCLIFLLLISAFGKRKNQIKPFK